MNASLLLYGPPPAPVHSQLAARRRWARRHPQLYASCLVDVAAEQLLGIAEQLAMSEGDCPGEVPDYETSLEPEDDGGICISIKVHSETGDEVGIHHVIEPWQLLESQWLESMTAGLRQ